MKMFNDILSGCLVVPALLAAALVGCGGNNGIDIIEGVGSLCSAGCRPGTQCVDHPEVWADNTCNVPCSYNSDCIDVLTGSGESLTLADTCIRCVGQSTGYCATSWAFQYCVNGVDTGTGLNIPDDTCDSDYECETGCCHEGECEAAFFCGDTCAEAWEFCTQTSDCCSGLTCIENSCYPPTCAGIGESCSESWPCCGWSSGNAVCLNSGSITVCQATCNYDSDCSSGCCVNLEGGGKACAPASFCSNSGGSGGNACDKCLDSCQGLPSCCTGLGCMCEDECKVSSCTYPNVLCCGPYGDCICTKNCPY